jgi:hypothetical protein
MKRTLENVGEVTGGPCSGAQGMQLPPPALLPTLCLPSTKSGPQCEQEARTLEDNGEDVIRMSAGNASILARRKVSINCAALSETQKATK